MKEDRANLGQRWHYTQASDKRSWYHATTQVTVLTFISLHVWIVFWHMTYAPWMVPTGILFLARWSKYHLSIWPLSRGELIPRLDEFIFFLVSQFLLQVLSRSFAPLPPFLDFSSVFPHPGRGIFPSLSGFTTRACFLKRCAQFNWVCILSTNPFCGLLHFHRQGISRFPQIGVVFLRFKKFVPPNRKHKVSCTPSLSCDQWAKNPHASQIGCSAIQEPLGVPDHGRMPLSRALCSWNAWVPQPITSSVIAIHVLIAGAESLRKAPDQHAVGREPSTKLSTRSVGSLCMSTAMTGSPGGYKICVPSVWPRAPWCSDGGRLTKGNDKISGIGSTIINHDIFKKHGKAHGSKCVKCHGISFWQNSIAGSNLLLFVSSKKHKTSCKINKLQTKVGTEPTTSGQESIHWTAMPTEHENSTCLYLSFFGISTASILFWKVEYWSPWQASKFSGQSSSCVPGVVKWIKYTFCTGRVLILPLPGNTGSSEACKHFEFGLAPQIARFRRLRALWTNWKTGFTRHNWT